MYTLFLVLKDHMSLRDKVKLICKHPLFKKKKKHIKHGLTNAVQFDWVEIHYVEKADL